MTFSRRARVARLLAASLLSLTVVATAASGDDLPLDIAPASKEAELAIKGFKTPAGGTVELVAAEPDVANPVAFCFDEQGRIYVAETFRQSKGVEDNRGHMNWLEEDLALQTVEERDALYRKFGGDKKVTEWTKFPDRIRRLEDRDGDGRFESATIFSTGYNALVDGTGAGVLAHRGNVYYTNIPSLYRLQDYNGDGVADQKTTLHTGYGVRTAFRGHDMHGLVWGYDGRLYFSIGDRGYNVVNQEGERLKRPETGAVFRCEPDGSKLEVFAYGLRNPQELAFNDEGDLFTGDNNSDGGDKARWVYVVPHGDTGWRMYYQYLKDRGPWNRERIWHPYRDDEQSAAVQPAYVVPPILNLADGPSGLAFDPGVGLPPELAGKFFLVDFRGSAANSGIRAFRVKPKGAGFEVVDSDWLVKSMLSTDVEFGYDGSIYATDWVDGWNGAGKGRIYRFRFVSAGQANQETARLFRDGFEKRSEAELLTLLGHPDRRVRLEAQFVLTERAVEQLAKGTETLATKLHQTALISSSSHKSRHAAWAWGAAVRRSGKSVGSFDELATSGADLQKQACRIAGDLPEGAFGRQGWSIDSLAAGLKSDDLQVRMLAALALGRHGDSSNVPALLDLLAANADVDPFIRHAGAAALAMIGDLPTLVAAADHPSKSVRLAAVVALRRLKQPELARALGDREDSVAYEAARAIHDEGIAGAMTELAAYAGRPGFTQRAQSPAGLEFVRRVLNANYRVGGPQAATTVAAIAADQSMPETVRLEATEDLLKWSDASRLDRVTGEFRPIESRPAAEAEAAVRSSIGGLLQGSDKLRDSAVKLAARYGIKDVGPILRELATSPTSPAQTRVEAIDALSTLRDSELPKLVDVLLTDSEPAVRAATRRSLVILAPGRAVRELATALNSAASTVIELQQAAEGLGSLKTAEADQALQATLDAWLAGSPAAAAVQLDILEAAALRGGKLAEAAGKVRDTLARAGTVAAYGDSLSGGNAARGKEVFFGNAAASCRRCHKINGEGSDVGPDLSEIGKTKARDYLLEAIVDPNAKIAEGFETAVFAMEDGRVLSGVVRGEDEKSFRIVTPAGETLTVEKSEIDDRAKGQSGMPADLMKQISRRELRDVVEYLSTLTKRETGDRHK
ncbi:PVC-type heme-binding CxxCH protein [Caulifigura coniformis]|nr:PVC-type heme-binding CxxCH protein [Caulifigura coniformis]